MFVEFEFYSIDTVTKVTKHAAFAIAKTSNLISNKSDGKLLFDLISEQSRTIYLFEKIFSFHQSG